MKKKKPNHKYLLSLYSRVDDFLSSGDITKEDLPDLIVSFCIVFEKVLKIKLHNKNPFLIFDGSWIKDDNSISIIALKKEESIETSKIKNILNRFEIVFKGVFTQDELQALKDIYEVRNYFVHGYKADDQIDIDVEDMVKKMGTIWEKISKIAISLFGKENIKTGKPKKKYTEKELENVLEEEVRKMIKPLRTETRFGVLQTIQEVYTQPVGTAFSSYFRERCPRCGSYAFSLDDSRNPWQSSYADLGIHAATGTAIVDGGSLLYKCKDCHLELTEKQYEIAKRIKDI